MLLLCIGSSRDESGAAELGAEEALAVVEGEAGTAQVEAAVTLQERRRDKEGFSTRKKDIFLRRVRSPPSPDTSNIRHTDPIRRAAARNAISATSQTKGRRGETKTEQEVAVFEEAEEEEC